jgi:hypothetical protein
VDKAWAEILPLIQTPIKSLESMSHQEQLAVIRFLQDMISVYEERSASQ